MWIYFILLNRTSISLYIYIYIYIYPIWYFQLSKISFPYTAFTITVYFDRIRVLSLSSCFIDYFLCCCWSTFGIAFLKFNAAAERVFRIFNRFGACIRWREVKKRIYYCFFSDFKNKLLLLTWLLYYIIALKCRQHL